MKISDSPRELDTVICLIECPTGSDLCGRPAIAVWQSVCESQCPTTPFGACSEHEPLLYKTGSCMHCGSPCLCMPA